MSLGEHARITGGALKNWAIAQLQDSIAVLMLYAGIVIVDGFFLQPYIMKRTARVPIWASLLTPIVLGILIPFWGVLISAPLLAVVYAYKERQARMVQKP